MTTVQLPNTITSLKYFTFAGTAISTVSIPESVKEIEAAVFYQCKNLRSIVIPQGVMTIGYSVFEGCSQLDRVTLPEKIEDINKSMFKNCSSLEEISIPGNVGQIREQAFYGCTSLQEVVIPDMVTNIGNSAFYNNYALTKITLGKGIQSIGYCSFAKERKENVSKDYSKVICYAPVPPRISNMESGGGSLIVPEGAPVHPFDFGVKSTTEFYIPKGTYNLYYLSDWGNYFDNIIEMD